MLLGDNSDDQNIRYILNEKVLNKDYEGELASIADSTFIDINIISVEELKVYKVTDKRYGLLIKTKVKAEPARQEVRQSKFEPELLILSVGGISFDPLLPYVYFTDPEHNIIGSICQYGNLDISILNIKTAQILQPYFENSKLEQLNAEHCT